MAGAAPIIIKRKKIIKGGGHHGGAWKVAYADFVTAMMAFFLLMWLLGATTEDQRKGLADFFNTTIPIQTSSGGGPDALSGDSILTQEVLADSGEYPTENTNPHSVPDEATLKAEIESLAQKAGLLDVDGRIRVTKTEEGTMIELVDLEGRPLFDTGSATPSVDMQILISSSALAIARTNVDVKVVGHTDAVLYSSGTYTNWELSADRANTARRMLMDAGVADRRITEVVGRADREPVSEDPLDPQNRRIAIILKNRSTPPVPIQD